MALPICAVATANGHGAIGVLRFSGDDSLALVQKIFTPRYPAQKDLQKFARSVLLGHLSYDNQLIDEVLLIPYKKNSSYTGEESGEIHCHGNPFILKQAMQALFAVGFTLAKPGEFTFRAYQNGRLDLSQAQAVDEIIQARGERELQNALYLMGGGFRKQLFAFRSQLLNLTADVAAELDFADEDITFVSSGVLINALQELQKQVISLIDNSVQSERLRKGLEIAISGAPNSGKSSLLNYFLGKNRAIVSATPGTTRDYIESEMQIDGVPVTLVDTAGIREDSEDAIEKEGIVLSFKKAAMADVILLLLDCSLPIQTALEQSPLKKFIATDDKKNTSQKEIKEIREDKIILLLNKTDIAHKEWDSFGTTQIKNFLSAQDYSKDNIENNVTFSDSQEKHPQADAAVPRTKEQQTQAVDQMPLLKISLREQNGLQDLQKSLRLAVQKLIPRNQGLMLSAWQLDRLQKLREELEHCQLILEHQEERELVSASLNIAIELLGELSGEIANEEILGRIFSRFCVGK